MRRRKRKRGQAISKVTYLAKGTCKLLPLPHYTHPPPLQYALHLTMLMMMMMLMMLIVMMRFLRFLGTAQASRRNCRGGEYEFKTITEQNRLCGGTLKASGAKKLAVQGLEGTTVKVTSSRTIPLYICNSY